MILGRHGEGGGIRGDDGKEDSAVRKEGGEESERLEAEAGTQDSVISVK